MVSLNMKITMEKKSTKSEDIEVKVSYDEGLKLAVQTIEKYARSKMHLYAYPLTKIQLDNPEIYQFSFPRVENGIPFTKDNISVGVSSETGKLVNFYINFTDIKEWPTTDKVVDKEVAKKAYLNELDVNLYYVNYYQFGNPNQFNLIYETAVQSYDKFYNAVTGEWQSYNPKGFDKPDQKEKEKISHPWAEKELNYMYKAGILKIEDIESFNADNPVTKGQALEVIMRSITRFWDGEYYGEEEKKATFENIDVTHPLYTIAERAADMGVLDRQEKRFDYKDALTREELAYWYVRALRLDDAAKHSDIYQLAYDDVNSMDAKYKGYIALASAFGLLQGDNGSFNPKKEVTTAELVVATFRLAEKMNEIESPRYY